MVVSRYAVVPCSLNIQRRQIKTGERGVLVLKQVVRHLVCQELVKGFHGGGRHSANKVIQHAWLIQLVRIEEHVTEFQVWTSLTELSTHSFEIRLQQAMTEPERRRCEFIKYCWVARFVISSVVPLW